jgi:hypothetical protein
MLNPFDLAQTVSCSAHGNVLYVQPENGISLQPTFNTPLYATQNRRQ